MVNVKDGAILLLSIIIVSYSSICNSQLNNNNTQLNQDKFTVYRSVPNSPPQLKLLQILESQNEQNGFDFWVEPRKVGLYCDIMVSPSNKDKLIQFFRRHDIHYTIMIEDVQELILRNEYGLDSSNGTKFSQTKQQYNPFALKYNTKLADDASNDPTKSYMNIGEMPAKYKFGEYSSYSTMIKYMRTVEFYFPTLVNLIRIGVSHEGRPIEGLKIGNPTTDGSIKRAFWVDGNIHAREWPSSHTALFVINQLVSGYGKDKFITHFLNHFDVYIFPVLNPDGLEYSRSSTNPTIRLWRKNRSPRKCSAGAWGGIKCCQGVDLNRNFDFFWSESGSSENPCSNQYQGSGPISEPESKAVHDFMTSDEMKGRFDGFITLHTYAQLFIHPYSHEYNNYPPDIADISKVAHKAINRLRAVYGTDYRYGTGADLLSPASGGSDDWAKSMLKIKYVYLIELRPEMELSGGFILNKEELIPTGIETFEAIKVVMEACLIKNKMPIRPPHLEDIKQRDDILGKFVPKNSELEKRILAKDDSLLNLPLPQKHNEVVKEEKVETSQSVPSTTAYPFDITNMFMNNGFDISTPNHKVTTNRPVMVHQVSTTTDRNWPKWTAWARMTRPVVETTEATTTTTIPTTTTTRLIATSTTTESTISVDNQHLSEMLFRKQLQRLKTEERLKSDEEEPVQVIDIRYEEEETYKPNIDETLSLPESVTISTPAKIAPNIVTLTKPKITIQPIKPSYQNIVKEECEDNQRSCTIWIKSRPNVCIKHSRFMKIQCRKGCHFCQTSN